jgi:hypothetical protein
VAQRSEEKRVFTWLGSPDRLLVVVLAQSIIEIYGIQMSPECWILTMYEISIACAFELTSYVVEIEPSHFPKLYLILVSCRFSDDGGTAGGVQGRICRRT